MITGFCQRLEIECNNAWDSLLKSVGMITVVTPHFKQNS